MIDRKDASEAISNHVRGGFDGPDEVLETMTESYFDPDDLEPADEAWLEEEIRRQFAEKRREEATWPAETDWDRLAKAFSRIEARGVLALHDAGVTQSDAISDAGELYHERGGAKSGLDGYVFYHRQDVDGALALGDLHIGFGKFRDDVDTLHAPAVAVAELAAAGFDVEWPGTPDKRILIRHIKWLKRSPKD